jgi:predicted nucleic acid-binding protein
MKNTLIADTGFWYALMVKRDRYHEQARLYLSGCKDTLISTWPVMTETCHLLLRRGSPRAVQVFMQMAAESQFELFPLQREHAFQMARHMKKFADLPMDLTDASLVVLAEELGHGRILSTDQRDFETYRWKNHKPFTNLLLRET